MNILIIDGQGGGMGKQLVSEIKKRIPDANITACGTNSVATNAMLKAGASHAATGENAIMVASKKADVIAGPLGIVIADALLGEITPKMAVAVAQSEATRILLPLDKCDNIIPGCDEFSMSDLIAKAVAILAEKSGEKSSC